MEGRATLLVLTTQNTVDLFVHYLHSLSVNSPARPGQLLSATGAPKRLSDRSWQPGEGLLGQSYPFGGWRLPCPKARGSGCSVLARATTGYLHAQLSSRVKEVCLLPWRAAKCRGALPSFRFELMSTQPFISRSLKHSSAFEPQAAMCRGV